MGWSGGLTPTARSGTLGAQWMKAKSNSPPPAQRQSSGRAKTQFIPISDRQKSVSRPVPQIAQYLSMRTHSSASLIRRCGDRLLWFVAMLLGGALPVAAHVGVLPLSSQRTVLPLALIQQIALSSIDVAAELATDTKAGNPLPLRFAVPQQVGFTTTNSGTWEQQIGRAHV